MSSLDHDRQSHTSSTTTTTTATKRPKKAKHNGTVKKRKKSSSDVTAAKKKKASKSSKQQENEQKSINTSTANKKKKKKTKKKKKKNTRTNGYDDDEDEDENTGVNNENHSKSSGGMSMGMSLSENLRLLAGSECPHVELVPDSELPRIDETEKRAFDALITREIDPNGGSWILVVDQDELNRRLDRTLHDKFALYFLSLVYSESENNNVDEDEDEEDKKSGDENDDEHNNDHGGEEHKENVETTTTSSSTRRKNGRARAALVGARDYVSNYALGVVRNSARHIPELIGYFATHFPHMIVKTSLLLNSKEINTLKISEYARHVNATFVNGTYRYGPLLQTSIVGVKNEEIGDYFPEFIREYLETSPFLRPVMPWGGLSINEHMKPQSSNDGPIIWAR